MKIVQPNIEIVDIPYTIEQMWLNMEKCGRLCYASESKEGNTWKDAKKWCESKFKLGHKSIGRHGSVFLKFTHKEYDFIDENLYNIFKYSPFVNIHYDHTYAYITTNYQFILDNDITHLLDHWCDSIPDQAMRYTFIVTTQISTSRELNRTSPNNIMEQSTRYCNFGQDKFNTEISICEPYWFNDLDVFETLNVVRDWELAENAYIDRVCNKHWQPQDAREFLPLATKTIVAYSFNIKELVEFINKRYFGTTGKPHPNAKIIAEKMYKYIIYNNNAIQF